MSRFIDDKEAEIQVGGGLSGLDEPRTEEDSGPTLGSSEKQSAGEDDGTSDEQRFRKRKSLQYQLLNNRQYKYRERKKKMEKQNSSFKMRKDTRTFYGKLATEKRNQKEQEKLQYEEEMALFRRKKEELQKPDPESEDDQVGPRQLKIIDEERAPPPLQKPPQQKPVVQYSDSDSESGSDTT